MTRTRRIEILASGLVALAAILVAVVLAQEKKEPLGFTDTPMIPGQPWHVNDLHRPYPPVVTPPDSFSELAPPPSGAIVLFDGKDLSQWIGQKGKTPAPWKVEDGTAEVVVKSGDIQTRQKFGSFQLHVEWAEPAVPVGNSQSRGNSGVFLHGLYEIQVLDCYNNITYADGQCGGVYGQFPPLVNACRKPGQWQTYDIRFLAPAFGPDKKLLRRAMVTVVQNGMLVQNHQELNGPTGHRVVIPYKYYDATGPLELQEHHGQVRYRNIWIRPTTESHPPDAADAVYAALIRTLPTAEFTGTFAEAIQWIHTTLGAPVLVNWNALSAAGIERAAPIKLSMNDVLCAHAIDTLLDQAAGANDLDALGDARPDYFVDSDGTVIVSTRADFAGHSVNQLRPSTTQPH